MTTAGAQALATALENMMTAEQAAATARNQFSWVQDLLVPGIQAAAQILLLNDQHSKYQQIASEKRALADAAVSGYEGCMDNVLDLFDGAFPDRPACAPYVPIDLCEISQAYLQCRIDNHPKAQEYATLINLAHQLDDLARAEVMNPRFKEQFEQYFTQTQQLLDGQLTIDEAVNVVSDAAELACLTGRMGNVCRTTARDLGIARMKLQAQGRKELIAGTDAMLRVSPQSRNVDMNTLSSTPSQWLQWAHDISQLVQNSQQNCYNLEASGVPWKMARIQAKLNKCQTVMGGLMSKSMLVNDFVPNYANALGGPINSIIDGLGRKFGGRTGDGRNGYVGNNSGWLRNMSAAIVSGAISESYEQATEDTYG